MGDLKRELDERERLLKINLIGRTVTEKDSQNLQLHSIVHKKNQEQSMVGILMQMTLLKMKVMTAVKKKMMMTTLLYLWLKELQKQQKRKLNNVKKKNILSGNPLLNYTS